MEINQKKQTSVQSVDRALLIIDLLEQNPEGIGVTELSNQMKLAKSTVHRILVSLQNKGLAKKLELTDKYILGLRFIELGGQVVGSLNVRSISEPLLKELSEKTGETVHLGIIDEGEVVYIDKIERTSNIRMYSRIGVRAALHCTGIGKAMLAYLPKEEVEKNIIKSGLKPYTPNTITTRTAFWKEMELIRKQGFSTDNEEHEPGICCTGSPIFNHDNKVIAGISIAGPQIRMNGEKLENCKKLITIYAKEISKRLGYRA